MIVRKHLGKNGPEVSLLCYGTLTMSPSQANLSPQEGGDLLRYAFNRGINFWDTAELYETYAHIKEALRGLSDLPVISTKSYAWDKSSAEDSLNKARSETGLNKIDIFMLHEQIGVLTMLGHADALKYFLDMRDKGIIGAVGISTHAIEVVQALALARGGMKTDDENCFEALAEFDLGLFKEVDLVHPIVNMQGIGIIDGSKDVMEDSLKKLHSTGAGIFGMKVLGGGNLLNSYAKAIDYALGLDFVDSFALGMQSKFEIDSNIEVFSGRALDTDSLRAIKSKERKLHVEDWCIGCGKCEERCKQDAIKVIDGKAVVNPKCVLCSYCAAVCPEFCIKVV